MQTDFEFFESVLPDLIKEHRGKFALIKDREIQGIYSSKEEALEKGYERFGNVSFLIQEITDEKRVHYINAAFIDRQL